MPYLFWFGILFLTFVPLALGIRYSNPQLAWVAAAIGAFIVFASKINEIAELSMGPVKAKMRATIQEAAATIEQLRNVATVISEGFLTDLMAGSFWGGMSLEKRLELHEKVLTALKNLNPSQDQLLKADENWKKGVSIIYLRGIRHAVEQRKDPDRVNPFAPEAAKIASKELELLSDIHTWTAPTPNQIRKVLSSHSINLEPVNKLLDDYAHYLEFNEIRNPKEFAKL